MTDHWPFSPLYRPPKMLQNGPNPPSSHGSRFSQHNKKCSILAARDNAYRPSGRSVKQRERYFTLTLLLDPDKDCSKWKIKANAQ